MATGDYVTLDELKRDLWPDEEIPDGVNDEKLISVITGVSREIDLYTGTCFYDTGADETRYYTVMDGRHCYIDAATTITSVAIDTNFDRTYSTVLAATDYEAWPYNTGARRGQPYARLDVTPQGRYSFPTGVRTVKVVARYCWNAAATVPLVLADIKQAALLKCVRMFKRKDAPFGVLGPTEAGQISVIPGFDPDELRILNNYKLNYT